MFYIFCSLYICLLYLFFKKMFITRVYKDNFGVYKKGHQYFYNFGLFYIYLFILFIYIFYMYLFFYIFISLNFIYYYCYFNTLIFYSFLWLWMSKNNYRADLNPRFFFFYS